MTLALVHASAIKFYAALRNGNNNSYHIMWVAFKLLLNAVQSQTHVLDQKYSIKISAASGKAFTQLNNFCGFWVAAQTLNLPSNCLAVKNLVKLLWLEL